MLFTDVFCGFPRGSHDAYVFCWSDLFVEDPVELAQLFSSTQFHIVGDGAYPLLSYLLCPVRNRKSMLQYLKCYNTALSSCRQLIERAFSLLKGKWKILFRGVETGDYLKVSLITSACCVLHNFCILSSDAPIVEDVPDIPEGLDTGETPATADTTEDELELQTQEMAQIWEEYGTADKAKENRLALHYQKC